MPLMAVQSLLPSTWLNGIIYITDDVRNLPQQLWKSYKAIYSRRLWNNATMISDFFRQWMGRDPDVEQRS
jgi:hypothetical protein